MPDVLARRGQCEIAVRIHERTARGIRPPGLLGNLFRNFRATVSTANANPL